MTDYTQLSNEALDALVHAKFRGGETCECESPAIPDRGPSNYCACCGCYLRPPYSSDIGAAWSVVEKMWADRFEVDLGSSKDIVHTPGQWMARFWRFGVRFGPAFVIDESQPRAIVIAALQALDRAGGGA